ncbi:hypothetical protein BGZ65_001180 [Modicella reniformis]|uniref:Uncharacterized protein n=1 Tax=Modicella reniformis TaxID=1440133 RepID=A0A9P6MJA2_9FUNG|nr:hypothetical protein BGZ65_001180 [Modicella reniformis]
MMKQNEIEVAKLKGDLDTMKAQSTEREALFQITASDLEKRIDQLTVERDAAEQGMNDARAKAEDISKAFTRAEKSKNSMATNRELMAKDFNLLKRNFEDLERTCKERDGIIADQRKEKEDYKRLYDKAKTRSLVQDIEKIRDLTDQLRTSESQFVKVKAAHDEKDEALVTIKSKLQRLQDEKNDELKQLGRLQEELASKDLELSDARSTSAGFEASVRIAERERESDVQRLSYETKLDKQKLNSANTMLAERENEIEFLKATIGALEGRSAEQTSRIQKEWDLSKERDNQVAILKANMQVLQAEITFKENQRQQPEPMEEEKLIVIKSEADTFTNDEELKLDLNRVLARLFMLEELIEDLEQDAAQARHVHVQATTAREELRRVNLDMQRDVAMKDEKIVWLERELERRKQDLKEKITELVDCKSRLQEQELKADLQEEEQKSLRHQIAMLERLDAEQQEQVEGRERALKRLEEARRLYDKVYESKIESLKEEMIAVERIAQVEWQRIRERHEGQMHRTMDRYQEAIEQVQRNLETVREGLKGDLMLVQAERDELKRRVDETEEALQRSVREIDDRNVLLDGYIALVSQQQADGILPIGSENIRNILNQRHDDVMTIQHLREHLQTLKLTLDDHLKIIHQYSQDMTKLTNRNETLVRQGQDRELELAAEKKTRAKEQAHLKALIKERDGAIQSLETELRSKTDALRRTEAALLKNTQMSGPVVTSSSSTL